MRYKLYLLSRLSRNFCRFDLDIWLRAAPRPHYVRVYSTAAYLGSVSPMFSPPSPKQATLPQPREHWVRG